MAKRNKERKERKQKKFIFFLVEGESDKIALETSLAELIFENQTEDFEVGFLLQQKYVNSAGEEFDVDDDYDYDSDSDSDSDDAEYIMEDEYVSGGDITSNIFASPKNIEQKIYHRFIKPAVKSGGSIYPKNIAKIIQITDLDGAYITDDSVKPFQLDREGHDGPFYNADQGVIETDDCEGICKRNDIKRNNIDYLLSLTSKGIKIDTKTIPYEIYFFSSNLDHFINHDANLKGNKKYHADKFLRKYGLDTEDFCKFFFEDPNAIGKMSYHESWNMVREGNNSLKRYTNIDCLIQKLLDGEI